MPTLKLQGNEISEVLRYFKLNAPNQTSIGGAARNKNSSAELPPGENKRPSVNFSEVLRVLREGPLPQDTTNRLVTGALNKIREHVMFLEESWKAMKDDSSFEPTFREVVTEAQLLSVLNFIDTDRSGTLELGELSHAFRVSRRFSVLQMLADVSSQFIFLLFLYYCMIIVRPVYASASFAC